MLTIYDCLANDHDLRLVLLAGVLCLVGVTLGVRLVRVAARYDGLRQHAVTAAGGGLIGLSAWTTHFLGMLGWTPGLSVAYPAVGVVTSLAMGLASACVGALVIGVRRPEWVRIMGGLIMGAGVAAMHFIGMNGLRLPAVLDWNPIFVGAAVVWSLAFLALGGATVTHRRRFLASALMGLGVIGLHFIAMAAVELTAVFGAEDLRDNRVLALTVGLSAAGLVLGIGALTLFEVTSRNSALRQLRDAIESMSDGMGFYDSEDRLRLWNMRYGELFPELAPVFRPGLSFGEIIDIQLARGAYPEALGREAEWRAERMAARRRLSSTMEQRLDDGRWVRVQDRRTADGGVVTVVNDITDLKRDAQALEAARDEAQAANRSKSEFLANMSHEIRTPLNGVIGVAQALARTSLDARQTEMLDLIQSSSATLQTLLSDILDLARVEAGRLSVREEPVELARAVREAADLYAATARDKGLQFFVEIDDACPDWILGDEVRIKQVLTNLVSNAVKFTAAGIVSLRVEPGPELNGGPTLRFAVEDTGVGFDAAARARLFSRFEQADGTITRRFGGTGLGLAICRQLAEIMGGELDCESEPGGGSAFFLTLPLAHAEAPAAPQEAIPANSAAEPGRPLRVLLADDHPTNRKVVELILAPMEVELTSAENGQAALAAFRGKSFDIVLMDMQMPVMDGLTATREIRLHEDALGQDRTPLIMLTANALPEHVEAARQAGADRHLAKPFSAADLMRTIGELARTVERRAA